MVLGDDEGEAWGQESGGQQTVVIGSSCCSSSSSLLFTSPLAPVVLPSHKRSYLMGRDVHLMCQPCNIKNDHLSI